MNKIIDLIKDRKGNRRSFLRTTAATAAACLPVPYFWTASSATAGAAGTTDFPTFKYHEIGRAGNQMGQTSLVDIDKDGRLDWVVGCSHGDVW